MEPVREGLHDRERDQRTPGVGSDPGSDERKPCCGEVSTERNVSRTGMRVRCGAQHYPGRSSVGSNRAVASHLPGQEKGRRCEMSWYTALLDNIIDAIVEVHHKARYPHDTSSYEDDPQEELKPRPLISRGISPCTLMPGLVSMRMRSSAWRISSN